MYSFFIHVFANIPILLLFKMITVLFWYITWLDWIFQGLSMQPLCHDCPGEITGREWRASGNLGGSGEIASPQHPDYCVEKGRTWGKVRRVMVLARVFSRRDQCSRSGLRECVEQKVGGGPSFVAEQPKLLPAKQASCMGLFKETAAPLAIQLPASAPGRATGAGPALAVAAFWGVNQQTAFQIKKNIF